MISVDVNQLVLLMSHYFWPALRLLALFMSAPFFSQAAIPKGLKIGLALLTTVLVAPTLPLVTTPIASLMGCWLGVKQLVIGTAIGLSMQVMFAGITLAGEVIGLQMGLSFATFFDRTTNANTSVIAQLLQIFMLLIFLSVNGHLWLIDTLVVSFQALPINTDPLLRGGLMELARSAATIFASGLMFGLPIITLLLLLNIILGILNRLTPQLSVFVIGFPLTLLIGLMALTLLINTLVPFSEHLLSVGWQHIARVLHQLGAPAVIPQRLSHQ